MSEIRRSDMSEIRRSDMSEIRRSDMSEIRRSDVSGFRCRRDDQAGGWKRAGSTVSSTLTVRTDKSATSIVAMTP